MGNPLLAAFAALFMLSPVSFDLMQIWTETDLIPAWPDSERTPAITWALPQGTVAIDRAPGWNPWHWSTLHWIALPRAP